MATRYRPDTCACVWTYDSRQGGNFEADVIQLENACPRHRMLADKPWLLRDAVAAEVRSVNDALNQVVFNG